MRCLSISIRRFKRANFGVWILLALWVIQVITCTESAHHPAGHSGSQAIEAALTTAGHAAATHSASHSDHSSPSESDCCDNIENTIQSDAAKYKFYPVAVALFVFIPLFAATTTRRIRLSEYRLLPGIPISCLIAASLQPNAPPL